MEEILNVLVVAFGEHIVVDRLLVLRVLRVVVLRIRLPREGEVVFAARYILGVGLRHDTVTRRSRRTGKAHRVLDEHRDGTVHCIAARVDETLERELLGTLSGDVAVNFIPSSGASLVCSTPST